MAVTHARRVLSLLALLCAVCLAPLAAAQNQGASVPITAVPAARHAQHVAVLPITGAIDDVTLWSLERRLQAAREQGYDAVVLELDTPGGEVSAMLDICLRIKSEAPTNTVAWIHPKAFSAGTFIALACREVVVAPGSVMGDAAPIVALPGVGITPLPAAERAKMESPLLDELDAYAQKRNADARLFHAFVAHERELWMIERVSPDGAPPSAAPIRRFADRADLGLLQLDPDAPTKPIAANGAASIAPLPPADAPIAASDVGAWRIVELVDTPTRLLVAQSDEALRWGLAVASVKDDSELQSFFAATEVVRFPESWTESVVRWLVSWPMRILLIAVFVVALVIETLHPGIGFAGAAAAVALLLLVGAPSLLGLAEWWEIALVIAGIALIALEIFVMPGTAFVGLVGGLCVLLGLIASFTGSDPTSAAERGGLLTATTTTVAGLTIGGILTWFASRWLGETTRFKSAVLSASLKGGHDAPRTGDARMPVLGDVGLADTDLRPSGRARFGEHLIDAQSTGDYIARGTSVSVVSRIGTTVIVEPVINEGSTA